MSEERRRVAICCQGGGSHTAFTAGVLARLLEARQLRRTDVVGLSGTSGGAICALLTWIGLRERSPEKATRLLADFWLNNSAKSPFERLQNLGMVSAAVLQGLGFVPAVTPYAIPPSLGGLPEFRALLSRHVDFDRIEIDSAAEHPMLLLGAVDVVSGRFRAFNSRTDRITADAVIASAAIPTVFRAVHTAGGVYWDGLFSQNPPVRDLLATDPDELWVIQINPQAIDHEPQTAIEIADRRNSLAGNLSLYQELGFIETIDQLLADGALLPDRGYRHTTVRIIELPTSLLPRVLGPASKLNRDVDFLRSLQRTGAEQAERFLAALAFERAVVDRDVTALRAAVTDDAVLRSTMPFQDRGAGAVPLSEHLKAIVDGEFSIDLTRKHVAGERAVWTLRMRDRPGSLGQVEVGFRDGRVAELRLGPATAGR
jgi:NTE family protein